MGTMLIGFDGSPCSERALQAGLQLGARSGATVALLYAVPPPPAFAQASNLDMSPLQHEHFLHAQDLLRRTVASSARPGLELRADVRAGVPVEVLAHAAEDPGVQLVIVGSHGKGPLAGAFLGSVSHGLLGLCKKPVLVVP